MQTPIALASIVVATLLLAPPAAATPSADATWPTTIVGVGIGGAGISPTYTYSPSGDPAPALLLVGIIHAEAAYRPSQRVPLYVRAAYVHGTSLGNNTWWNARLGGELRGCSSPRLCGIVDADVGYLHIADLCQDMPSATGSGCNGDAPVRGGLSLNGRIGVDTGWEVVRVRIALDFTRALPANQFTLMQYGESRDLGGFVTFEIGVALAL
jgi:hypothetical protein